MQPALQPSVSTTAPAAIAAGVGRVQSIDIFRGLTILVMIFVNDVSGVRGLPWWTYHMPEHANGMTYVDMVFPTFLFIVGLSVPLAFERRIAKGDSRAALWLHMALRSLGLVTLGLILANFDKISPALTGMGRTAWRLLALGAVVLLWNAWPRSPRWASIVLRCAGLALLMWLLATFRRRTEHGHVAGLDFSYWEILGLIGWAYLSACILYLLFRRWPWALIAAWVALNAMNVLCAAGRLEWPANLPDYVWPFETGALASIVMAGVVASLMVVKRCWQGWLTAISVYGIAMLIAGYALQPLGISKNRATPTWCLYSSAAAVILFVGLYWIADVRHATRWAAFVKPAGSNTLLTYLLPWAWYTVPALDKLGEKWHTGAPGVMRALCFTAVILGISAVLTRMKLRLQL